MEKSNKIKIGNHFKNYNMKIKDIFRNIDRDNTQSISENEFISAITKLNLNFNNKQI